IEAGKADAGDVAKEGDIADHESGSGPNVHKRVRLVFTVGGEGGSDDLDVLAEALGEKWAQGSIGEAHREGAIGAGAAFAARESAGDLAEGAAALFGIDRAW